jgi:hypothetical protein
MSLLVACPVLLFLAGVVHLAAWFADSRPPGLTFRFRLSIDDSDHRGSAFVGLPALLVAAAAIVTLLGLAGFIP